MMYYHTNALYEHLKKYNINRFEFVAGNQWQLVYGDASCIPKLLVVVSGVAGNTIMNDLSVSELNAYNRMRELGSLAVLPVAFIRFAVDKAEVESVSLYNKQQKFEIRSMQNLTQLYAKCGLPTRQYNQGHTDKYLNDKESSAYHKWQRHTLGSELKVTDIDLFKINTSESKICEVYELKRSYINIAEWAPFKDDYNNFRLLGNVLANTGISLKIAYNVRTKSPWNDDISRLKLFNVNVGGGEFITYDKTVSIDEFLNS